ncbi:MAG: hypothetical protein F6J94_26060 [Moorea sp. SIO1F2]|uniref:hypothetical protein n=1 Tax=Moorena sp. SIO1F2 TaxID=2607819 RepID=UPI0013BD8431|nr:hypothetical protein [Moorena sp. SIO1F2]NET85252.1 hypothetical protein [Moorena sp. SIO1F2]
MAESILGNREQGTGNREQGTGNRKLCGTGILPVLPTTQFRFPTPDSRFPFPSWEGLGVGPDSRLNSENNLYYQVIII